MKASLFLFSEKIQDLSVVSIKDNSCFLIDDEAGSSEYINAVFCDSYKKKKDFIMSQIPTVDGEADFWRLIYIHNVSAIVLFDDDQASVYWPTELSTPTEYKNMTVELIERSDDSDIMRRKFHVKSQNHIYKSVIHWQIKGCSTLAEFNDKHNVLFNIQDVIVKHRQHPNIDGPILIQCLNGADISGLFIALSYTLEKVLIDRYVDVLLAVIQVRRRRSNAITTYKQFKTLNEIISKYANNNEDTYYNTNH